MDYLFLYIEILVLCLVITLIILFNVQRDLGTDLEVAAFKWMLCVLAVALVMDGLTHAHYRGAVHLPPLLVGTLYATYMWLFSGVLSYLWLVFAELRIGGLLVDSRRFFAIGAIPVVILAFFSYGSLWTGWFFSVDAQDIYTRGPLWAIQSFVAYSYFLFTTVHAVYSAHRERSPQRRRELLVLSSFIISPLIGALLQLLVGGHPLVGPSVCISILLIFISMQGNMIYHDSLTGLNNRKRTDQYLEEMVDRAGEGYPFYLYVLDVDRFKNINDSLGHGEGDRALLAASDALRRTVGEFHGFVGRYGGDEFVCIVRCQDIDDPEQFGPRLACNLDAVCNEKALPYQLSISVGYAQCSSSLAGIPALVEEADAMLYRNKGLAHR